MIERSDSTARNTDSKNLQNTLFLQQRIVQMEYELALSNEQTMRFATDLTTIYREAKVNKRELAQTNNQLTQYAVDLRKTISELRKKNRTLREAYYDTINRLVIAAEYKDRETGKHIARISRYSAFVARKFGLSDDAAEQIFHASSMHDVGKIGIPDSILLKEGQLTCEEFDIMKSHTIIGANILRNAYAPVLQMGSEIALYHHERWDGDGYPHQKKNTAIPLSARIVALVDTFDALTTSRPYKKPYPIDVSCSIIRKEREKYFDPDLVDIFLDNIADILIIREETDAEPVSQYDFEWSDRDLKSGYDQY